MNNIEDSKILSFTARCERDGDSCRLVEEDDVPAFDFTDRYGAFLKDGEEYEVIVRKVVTKDFKITILE